MNKILSVKQAIDLNSRLKKQNKTIVLVGGGFDILHIGHVKFLEKAKLQGDFLFVLLESDESVRKLKGKKRPFNSQEERAMVLSALSSVDFVVALKGLLKNSDYDRIVRQLSPNVLATTAGDSKIEHKARQAKLIGARVAEVIERLPGKSTTKILEVIK